MSNSITDEIMQLAAEAGDVPLEHISLDSSFESDLNFDSLTRVEFAMEVEDKVSVSVADDRLDSLKTIRDVVRLVEEQTPGDPENK